MKILTFSKVFSKIEEINWIQDHLLTLFSFLSKVEIIDGRLKKDVSLVSSGATNVDHGLGREYQGFIVTRKNANSNVWETTANTRKKDFIILNCSADTTVDLWFF